MKLLILIGIIFGIFFSCSKPTNETINYKCIKTRFYQANPGNTSTSIDSNIYFTITIDHSQTPFKINIPDDDLRIKNFDLNNFQSKDFNDFSADFDSRSGLNGNVTYSRDNLNYIIHNRLSPATNSVLECNCTKQK